MRILLIGRTGACISFTGNTVLHKKCFHEGRLSVTSTTKKTKTETTIGKLKINGKEENVTLLVADTPGFGSTSLNQKEVISEIAKGFEMLHPGVHAILFIDNLKMRYQRPEHEEVLNQISHLCDEKIFEFIIVVLTDRHMYHKEFHEDKRPLMEKLKLWLPEYYMRFLRKCGDRVITLDTNAGPEVNEISLRYLFKMIVDISAYGELDKKHYSPILPKKEEGCTVC